MKLKQKTTYMHWVVGFLIKNNQEVALVQKTHPAWQKGKLNGVGGKIDRGESPEQAMQREFKEEAGLTVRKWREFALLKVQDGQVYFFVAHGKGKIKSVTDERVAWYKIQDLKKLPIVDNLTWLVPLALDEGLTKATIDYFQKH